MRIIVQLDYPELADELIKVMEEKRLAGESAADFWLRAGISRSLFWKWMKPSKNKNLEPVKVKLDTLLEIEKRLGCKIDIKLPARTVMPNR